MFLLDTNIISELRRKQPHPRVAEWAARADRESLFMAAVSVGELRQGIERVRRSDPAFADDLERWLADVEQSFLDRVLALDWEVADAWGRMMARDNRNAIDAQIAATALVHGLQVVTRNVRDFQQRGVAVLNPFEVT